MKKLISILIAMILCFGLVACGGKTDTPATTSGEQQSSSPPSSSAPASTPANSIPQGYLEDDVDHHARDTYNIAYLTDDFQFLQQAWFAGMQAFEDRLNVKMTSVSADGSQEKFIANIELLSTRGYDGALVLCYVEIQERATELLNESGVPWICFATMLRDENNKSVAPCVMLDQYEVGWRTMRWLVDNYQSYWGDIDKSKVGAIDITFSVVADLYARCEGPRDLFKENFPDGTFFQLDVVSTGVTGSAVASPEPAYDLVTATVSANPQLEYWFVTGATEFYGPGAARALEALGRTTDNALVCVVGSGANIVDWESMSKDTMAINVACLVISDMLYGAPSLAGIIALIDGRETKNTLWQELLPPNYEYGNDYGIWLVENKVVTRWEYQEYLDETNALLVG